MIKERKVITMLKIYLSNLGKYNEGDLVGEWVTLPIGKKELEEVKERIGINEQYEEFFISDYESDIDGLEIGEYDNIDQLNRLVKTLNDLNEYDREIAEALLSEGYSIDDIFEIGFENMYMYDDCKDMEDVARAYCKETSLLDNVPEDLKDYFDFEAYGRDMATNGTFIFTNNGKCVHVSD